MKRREFITLLGGAAATWPMAASAQQMRRVGVIIGSANDAEGQSRISAFQQGLEKLGWSLGRNLQIDYRLGANDIDRARATVAELLSLEPDVILSGGSPALLALQQATRTVPIVFAVINDPVAQGFVQSLAHPGGNITGFTNLEITVGPKWLDLLKEIAPRVTRVAILFNPITSPVSILFANALKESAPKFGVDAIIAPVQQREQIEAVITKLGRDPDGGLIIPTDPFTSNYKNLIVELANRYQLPAISGFRVFAAEGGLLSYGIDAYDIYRRASTYVDRILRGEKPADLPVQQPIKFELVINLQTAKALGLTVPNTLLVSADEVIE